MLNDPTYIASLLPISIVLELHLPISVQGKVRHKKEEGCGCEGR